jgi:UDP-N-acetylglucosamine 2-epimerase (non-hydrolysing)
MDANIMLTDSGGLQEHGGASVLVGNNIEKIKEEYFNTLKLERKPERPELWDGKTAGRCLMAILNFDD